MWYAFQVINGLKEKSDVVRICAEISQYIVYCSSEIELNNVLHSKINELCFQNKDIKIFDNLNLDNTDPTQTQLHLIDGEQLAVKVRAVRQIDNFFSLQDEPPYCPIEISHMVVIFNDEESFYKFSEEHSHCKSYEVTVFEDPDRHFLAIVD